MYKVVIIGGGWSGCAAALAARKAGAEVTLLEKTDMLLGLGNVGGIMRNNGRFTAAEENIALGARELFDITDRCSRHVNIDFPGHKHASLYDVMKVEPNVRRLLREKGVDVRLMARAVDVVLQKSGRVAGGSGDQNRCSGIGHSGKTRRNTELFDNGDMQDAVIEKRILAGNPAGIGVIRNRPSKATSSLKPLVLRVRWVTALHTVTGVACVSSDARHLVLGSVSVQEPAAAISWAAGGTDPSGRSAAVENWKKDPFLPGSKRS